MKLYRAAAPFVWVNPKDPDTIQVFNESIIFRDDHPAVIDKPSCFVEVTEDNAHGVIEQTSSAPGEKRNTRVRV